MYPNEEKQTTARRRRVERYAAVSADEPSMSAPMPMPGKAGADKKADAANASAKAVQQPEATPPEAMQPYAPWQQGGDPAAYPMQQGWSQPCASPVQADWSQPYAAQPQQGWPQAYPPQEQMDWSQGYPAQPQGDWQQGYPAQPQGDWQQAYPAQAQADWSQPYPAQPQQCWPQPYQYPNEWQPVSAYNPAPEQAAMLNQMQPGMGSSGHDGTKPPVRRGGSGDGGGPGLIPKWVKLAAAAAVLVGIIALLVAGGISISESNARLEEVSAYNDKFCEGVYVDGIHLGGMTQQEAVDAVTASAQQRLQAWNVRLTYGANGGLIRTITASDLGMTVNVNEALEEAWEQGHDGSNVEARKAAMDALLEDNYHGYTALPSGDTSAIDKILQDLAAVVYTEPQDAYVVEYNPDAHSYPFVIEQEKIGYYLDVEPVKARLYQMVDNMESGSIELTPQTLQPSVTEADLRKTRTLRGTALTEISTTSTQERNANIERAFKLINGTTLKPGESFSFNGIVGARTAKNGFYKAIEYAYGQEREGYGGGVCQASTTIYLAAIRANMTITHREPHSDKVNYTAYGLDATVNYDGKKIDLTFKNTTNSDIYILSYLVRANGRWNCRVDIYGEAHEEGVTYDLIAETVEILPAPEDPEYVEDESGTYVMYIDDTPVQKRKASDGVIVETFKVKYLNGQELERTYVARDTYKAKAQQLWVGVNEREDSWTQ